MPFTDTWEYDGSRWSKVASGTSTSTGPARRIAAGATYDSKRGLMILFGRGASDGEKSDTWSWNGMEWKQLASSGPPARSMGFMAYDRVRDRVVMFGGRIGYPDGDRNDTWEGTAPPGSRLAAELPVQSERGARKLPRQVPDGPGSS